jgi:diacylglycerol kinase (ATP)
MNTPQESPTAQKTRSGLARIMHATGYSLAGLRVGMSEPAFRQEVMLACLLIPAAFWLGRNWLESSFLIATVVIVMITELLNTGIERSIDRIGPEWHELSKTAKDLGSAAVLLSLVLCAGVWLSAIASRFI